MGLLANPGATSPQECSRGLRPQTPLLNGVWGGAPTGGGGAPNYILAAKSPRGLGRSPKSHGPPGPPLLATALDLKYRKIWYRVDKSPIRQRLPRTLKS